MGKKDKDCHNCARLTKEIQLLESKLMTLEQVRNDQVDELLTKQQELFSDVAELLVRNSGKID